LEQNLNEYLISIGATIRSGTYVIFVGPIYNYVELLVECVISGTYLKFFKMCWVGGIEYLLGNIIKKV
jgi:hypothetical protein